VHLYGNLCDLNALQEIGAKYDIPIIEDAAEAIGSEYFGRKAGSIGAFGAFSFHGTKTLTTGEGGMFVTNDADLYERVLTLSNHGRRRGQTKTFWPDDLGFKYKMSNVQAAIGCAQVERIDELIARKREIYHGYRSRIERHPAIAINPEHEGTRIGAWMPTAVFSEESGVRTDRIVDIFKSTGIDARPFFWPLSSLPMFNEIGSCMTESDIGRVVDTLMKCFD